MTIILPSRDLIEKQIRSELIKINNENYTLDDIYQCLELYVSNEPSLEKLAESFAMQVLSAPGIKPFVHSVRYRLKRPLSLADKLVRKCLDKKDQKIIKRANLFDTERGIKDLGGVRILLLRREDWEKIHEYLVTSEIFPNLNLVEKKCYAPKKRQEIYINRGFEQNEVEFDEQKEYTSLHYTFREKIPGVHGRHHIECQVRTIFEEGWGEIDHQMNYPHKANLIARGYLTSLNASAQVANEIASKTGTLLHLPRLVHWDAELRLERSADNIYCITPGLDWVSINLTKFINHVRESRGTFYYFIIDNTNDTQKNYEDVMRKLGEKKLLEQVNIFFVPDELKKIPVVSDVLFLEKACTTKNSEPEECDISVVGAPAQKELISPEEHLDMLIFDSESASRLRSFFEDLKIRLQ